MLVRRMPWTPTASGLRAGPLGRFAGPDRGVAFWAVLWLAAIGAEVGALIPVIDAGGPIQALDVVFRVTGGSFLICGLIAWRRRPDSRAGPLMTATGFSLFIVPIGTQVEAPLAHTLAFLLADLWSIFFVALLLTFVTGGRVRSRIDPVLIGGFVLPLIVLQFVYMSFWEQDGNLLTIAADADVADAIDKV